MTFEEFSTVDFPPINREAPAFVYVWFRVSGSEEVPFYVGQTSRLWGRLDDYYWAMFSASTDFRVGEACRHLSEKSYRIVLKYKPTKDPRGDESKLIEQLRGKGYALLNDLRGFNYLKADESEERSRLQKFLDETLSPRR